MPRVVHATPDHTVDREPLENDLRREIDVDRPGRNAEHVHPSCRSREREGLMHRTGHARHLEYDIGTMTIGGCANRGRGFVRMHRVMRAHRTREFETPFVDVGRNNPRRAGRATNADCKRADGTTSRDQHDRSRNLCRERRMKCIPHRIVNAADVIADRVIQVPNVRRRHRDVLGEAPVAVHADDARARIDVCISGATEERTFIDDVSFGRDAIADFHRFDERSDLDDIAGKLVSNHKRRLAPTRRPCVPLVNVDVGSAHAGASHANKDLIIANSRLGDFGENHAASSRLFDQRFHVRSMSTNGAGMTTVRGEIPHRRSRADAARSSKVACVRVAW